MSDADTGGWSSHLEDYFAAKAPTYDAVGSEPYWQFSDALLWRHVSRRLSALPSPIFHLLDAGGGTGRWTIRTLMEFPEATATILDASSSMLAVARQSSVNAGVEGRLEIVQADLDTLQAYPKFDVAYCFHNVLGFVADPIGVVHKLHDSMNETGVAALVVPNMLHGMYYSIKRGEFAEYQRIWNSRRVRFSKGPSMRVFDPPEIAQQLQGVGFQVTIYGFPVSVFPAPSQTFARADDATAQILGSPEVVNELLEVEWNLSRRRDLAVRGNNLLAFCSRQMSQEPLE